MSRMRLGVSPLSWMNSDIPSLGSEIPIEQCLREAAEIGYEGVELEDPMRKILDKLPGVLSDCGLTCAAGWHSTFLLQNSVEKELESLKTHMDLLDKIGACVVNLAECTHAVHRMPGTPLTSRLKLDDEAFKKLAYQLDFLADYMAQQGFISAYHHHMGTVIQDADDIQRLMENTEKLGLLFDTGHLVYAQDEPMEVLNKHLGRITHVHLKNVRSSVLQNNLDQDTDFFSAILDGAFTVPGDASDGGLDFYPMIEILKGSGYKGWMIVEAEQDPAKAPPYEYARLGYKTLTISLVSNPGLR